MTYSYALTTKLEKIHRNRPIFETSHWKWRKFETSQEKHFIHASVQSQNDVGIWKVTLKHNIEMATVIPTSYMWWKHYRFETSHSKRHALETSQKRHFFPGRVSRVIWATAMAISHIDPATGRRQAESAMCAVLSQRFAQWKSGVSCDQ